jgi:hypothetical protein
MTKANSRRSEDPLGAVEAEETEVADRLRDERPYPSIPFVERLRQGLFSAGADHGSERRATLTTIAAELAMGAILLLLAAVGVAGVGPFAS